MQVACSSAVRLVAALAIGACLSLAGCGGGRDAALQRYKTELELLDRKEQESEKWQSKFRELDEIRLAQIRNGDKPSKENRDKTDAVAKEVFGKLDAELAAQRDRVIQAKATLDSFGH